MKEPNYSVEFDNEVGLYRWRVAPGQSLLGPAVKPRPRVVALGGGTGLPIVLGGLKAQLFPPGWRWDEARDRDRITAIVTVADDGGSSGKLRRLYRILPPGDIRNCLLALAHDQRTVSEIFKFRFNGRGELEGHSLGNLILTALSQIERDFSKALERGSEILGIRGKVLPATSESVTLLAEFTDGSSVEGESEIAAVRRPVCRVRLQPEGCRALPQALESIKAADLIVLGPGSLYTSLIPILLVGEIAEAIARSRARVVLVMNLMTEPGETDGYTAAEHLLAIRRHVPGICINDVLFNTAPIPEERQRRAADGAAPIFPEVDSIRALGCRPAERDLLAPGPGILHEPSKLAESLLEIATECKQ